MHKSSLEHMQQIAAKYLGEHNTPLRIADIGSYDVNGSYKPFFTRPDWTYIGVDLAHGPNVDIVLQSPYILPFASHSLDIMVSGQAFEHIEFFWLTWLEMARVLKPGGMIFLIAPSRGPEHRYPQDCWRFYPDGFASLAKFANFELLEVHTDWHQHNDDDSAQWGDTVGVFRQPDMSWIGKQKRRFMQQLRRRLLPGYR